MAPYICFYRVWPNLTIPPIWFYHFNFHPPIYSPSPNLLPEFSNSPKLTTGIQGRPSLVKNFFWRAVRLWERGDSHFLRVSFRKQLWRYSKKWSKWLGLCWRWPFVCSYCVQCLRCQVRWSNCDWWWFGDPNDRCQLDLLWKKPGLSVLTRTNNYFKYFHRTKKSLN